MKNFADRLIDTIGKKKNPSIIGLDTELLKVPGFLRDKYAGKHGDSFEAASLCILEFNRRLIDSLKAVVPAVKIQSAFYEQYGFHGVKAFMETAEYAKAAGLIVVGDVKRNDIGNTSRAYSKAYLGRSEVFSEKRPAFDLDCITVNPYLGTDGVAPFVEDVKEFGKGIFVLVKTSNPSSSELQNLEAGLKSERKKIYEVVAELVRKWGEGTAGKMGYNSVGAVVGATFPEEAKKLRKIMEKAVFLVPGYGAQGGGAGDAANCFNPDGYGAIVHSARDVIYAFQKSGGKEEDFAAAAKAAAMKMKEDLTTALEERKICPW